ncbi:efflux RND transporter periplasmic adaptor subunit [Gayadomonas joobiniege]|uniref:efflux RND transporter periplasmic adaptor subunit n=1 Tax=Gayadomonas joobiniege TaxID=1234606 RepID=UPI0003649185|nr:efflux RND transporter periplasmic adaptor subunit [Gayadomonas joobiniege]
MKTKAHYLLPPLILIGAIGLAYMLVQSKETPAKKPIEHQPPLVEVESVSWQNWPIELFSQGFVQATQSSQLSAQITGQVNDISEQFKVGMRVTKGTRLLTMDDSDYRAQLASAKANRSAADAALSEEKARGRVAEAEWQNISDQPTDLALRKPQLAAAEADLAFAKAQLEDAELQLLRTRIFAPYNAIIVSRDAQLGDYLSPGKPVATLHATDSAEVRLPVTTKQLGMILGDHNQVDFEPIAIRLTSLEEPHVFWSAQLVRSEKIVTSDSQVIYLIADIQDPYNIKGQHAKPLFFGQYVQAQIPVAEVGKTARIERSLLTPRETLLVENSGVLHIRSLDIRYKDKNYVYLASGLKPGDRVITSALSTPVTGMKIRVQSQADGAE